MQKTKNMITSFHIALLFGILAYAVIVPILVADSSVEPLYGYDEDTEWWGYPGQTSVWVYSYVKAWGPRLGYPYTGSYHTASYGSSHPKLKCYQLIRIDITAEETGGRYAETRATGVWYDTEEEIFVYSPEVIAHVPP